MPTRILVFGVVLFAVLTVAAVYLSDDKLQKVVLPAFTGLLGYWAVAADRRRGKS